MELIFLVHYFPPAESVGALRAWYIAKHLAELNWKVTVLTRRWDDGEGTDRIRKECWQRGIGLQTLIDKYHFLMPYSDGPWAVNGPYWYLGKLLRFIARAAGIEKEMGWVQPLKRALYTMRPGAQSVVMATGGPFFSFKVAGQFAARSGLPLALDYRDLWSDNPHVTNWVNRKAKVPVERALLQRAALVTTVSPSMKAFLHSRFGVGAKIAVVSNGYDDEDLACVEPTKFDEPAVIYAGQLYPPKRSIDPIMRCLKRMIEREAGTLRSFKFHYYGRQNDHVLNAAQQHGLSHLVVYHGFRPRKEALSAIAGARLCTVVASVSGQARLAESGIVTAKVFEPLGLKVPTLVVAPQNSDLHEIAAKSGTLKVFTADEVEGMAQFAASALRDESHLERGDHNYAWSAIAKTLDTHLKRCLNTPSYGPPRFRQA